MAVFAPREYKDFFERMLHRVVGRTELTDVEIGGIVSTIIGGVARELDDISYQIVALQDLWDLDTARGEDLDARAADCNPTEIKRKAATKASGKVKFTRTVTGTSATIAAGTTVQVSGGTPAFVTTTSATFGSADTESTEVQATAKVAGVASNCDAGTVVEFDTPIAVADAVTNTTPMTGGQDQETDAQLRERIKTYLLSLPRATPDALKFAVLGTVLDSYGRIQVVQVWEEPEPYLGQVKVYVGDGNGTIERTATIVDTLDSSGVSGIPDQIENALSGTTTTVDPLVRPASGGEIRFGTSRNALIDDGTLQVWWFDSGGTYAGSAALTFSTGKAIRLVEGTSASAAGTYDFIMNYATGFITLYPGGPGGIPDAATASSGVAGLQAGDAVAAMYTFYEGLIAEAQKIIDGDPSDRENYPGYRAAGVHVEVLPPTVYQQRLYATVTVESGFTASVVTDAVQNAIIAYINGLGINDDVIASELIYAAQTVSGVFDVVFTDSSGTAITLSNTVMGEGEIARTSTTYVTVTGA